MSSTDATAKPTTTEAAPPRLAEGVELLGEFEGSGFKEPPHLARRADGQVIQLSRLLHLVAEAADGRRDAPAMAEVVGERSGRQVSADNIEFLVEEKLRPLGLVAARDGSSPQLRKLDPLLALRHRRALVPEGAVQGLARAFGWLFATPVLAVLLAALLAFDAWLFLSHGIAGGLRGALYDPVLLLGLFAAVVVATAFHEVGHASACRYGGARPGVLGAGVYLVWPAFYCDVTDAYRLGKAGRLRTDLGGVYFNALFSLVAAGAFLATGFEPLLLVLLTQHMIIVQQLIPVLRFDGYYVISDLTGVPDILTRIRPILASLLPRREADARVHELKPWVRVVVTAYVLTLVPVLLFLLVFAVMSAPRMFATAYDSLGLQLDRFGTGGPAETALGVLQIAALVLPCAGLALSFGRVSRRAGGGLWRWGSASAPRAAVAVAGVAAVVGLAGWTWWPNGDYEPLRPGERGTLGEAVSGIAEIPSGRPSFTPEREARVGDEPTEREREAQRRAAPPPGDGAPAGETEEPAADRDQRQPEVEATPEPTAEPTPESTATPTPEPTATPEPAATATPEATPTATPTAVP